MWLNNPVARDIAAMDAAMSTNSTGSLNDSMNSTMKYFMGASGMVLSPKASRFATTFFTTMEKIEKEEGEGDRWEFRNEKQLKKMMI